MMSTKRKKSNTGKLRMVSRNPEVRRAEQAVHARQLEVNELTAQLEEAKQLLESALSRLDSIKRKHQATGKSTSTRLDKCAELDYNSKIFEKDPSKRLAKKSLEVARKVGSWDALSLTGLYLEETEKRYARPWRGTAVGLHELYTNLIQLYERVGDEAADAITAVFSPKMKWVTGNHISLLLKVDGYERYILPTIMHLRERGKRSGEQSQSPVPHSKRGTVEEVKL